MNEFQDQTIKDAHKYEHLYDFEVAFQNFQMVANSQKEISTNTGQVMNKCMMKLHSDTERNCSHWCTIPVEAKV